MKALAWALAAALSLALLGLAASHGDRPDPGMDRYVPAGLMLAIPPDQVTAVTVRVPGRALTLVRDGARWGAAAGAPPADATAAVERGLRFLHGSAPVRTMAGEEAAGVRLEETGLVPPALQVEVRVGDRTAFAVDFGGTNPQGFATYARVAGRPEIHLLSRYVAGAWKDLVTP